MGQICFLSFKIKSVEMIRYDLNCYSAMYQFEDFEGPFFFFFFFIYISFYLLYFHDMQINFLHMWKIRLVQTSFKVKRGSREESFVLFDQFFDQCFDEFFD